MKTTIIPAQITTVEDTIAGNLNLTQIILLLTPVFLSTFIYALLPQRLAFTTYKIPLIVLVSLVFILLSLRIKGRLVFSWIGILSIYFFRPHLYLFNKNTLFARDFIIPARINKSILPIKAKIVLSKKAKEETTDFDYESLSRTTDINLRFTRKGLLVVKQYD